MADTAVLLEIITYIFQRTPPTADCDEPLKGSSQPKVGGEWFEIKLGKISRMLVKYEVLPIPNVIFVC